MLTTRIEESSVDPVVAAAIVAFAFVFIHPFEDGNGRIHRFLMHQILAKRGYSPDGVIFPVSAAILRDRRSYDDVLETFSKQLLDLIEWRWTTEKEIAVTNETGDFYRYFDATAFVEYFLIVSSTRFTTISRKSSDLSLCLTTRSPGCAISSTCLIAAPRSLWRSACRTAVVFQQRNARSSPNSRIRRSCPSKRWCNGRSQSKMQLVDRLSRSFYAAETQRSVAANCG